jgi:hypothetical protein
MRSTILWVENMIEKMAFMVHGKVGSHHTSGLQLPQNLPIRPERVGVAEGRGFHHVYAPDGRYHLILSWLEGNHVYHFLSEGNV